MIIYYYNTIVRLTFKAIYCIYQKSCYNMSMEALTLSKPHLIIMTGIPGAGKSYFAERFAESFKAPIVSSTLIRKSLFDEPTFEEPEDYIVDKMTIYLLTEMLKTNRTVIFKGKTDTRSERLDIYKQCKAAGYEPLLVWVQTDVETAKNRFNKQISDKSLSESLFKKRLNKFSQPIKNEFPVVISGKFNYNSQLKIILKRLIILEQPIDEHKSYLRNSPNQRYLIR